jgi:lipopolysaccharide biosynthesis glycosyltransferase
MTNRDDIDIMVMCSDKYKFNIKNIKSIEGINDIWIVPHSTNGVQTSMKKVLIYDYPKIHDYDYVLYLDSDIVLLDDVQKLFLLMKHVEDDNVLYIFEEKDNPLHHYYNYWSLGNYKPSDIEAFAKRKQNVFNCGHWGFKVSNNMLTHFQEVANMILSYRKTNYFYEQSFMNVYFNTNFLTKPVFNEYIMLTCYAEKSIFVPDKTILIHVADSLKTPQEKLNHMKMFYDKYIDAKTV